MVTQHLKVVAWLHLVIGVLTLAFGCWSVGLGLWIFIAPASETSDPHPFHEGMLSIALVILGAILLPIGILQAVAGRKLFLRKMWAKRAILILVWVEALAMTPFVGGGGAIYILLPIVLGLAGYSTWVFLQQETVDCFANGRSAIK